jgi:hypothetical protein
MAQSSKPKVVNITENKYFLKSLDKSMPQFSQQRALSIKDPLIATAETLPLVFTSTYSASLTADHLFRLGVGEMDPEAQVRLLLQVARDTDVPFESLATEYRHAISSFALNVEAIRKVVVAVIGSSDRALRPNNIPGVTPSYLFTKISAILPETNVIIRRLVTEFFCDKFRPLGWIYQDSPIVYRVQKTNTFPRKQDLVDIVDAYDLVRMMRALGDVKISLVGRMLDESRSVQPSFIVNQVQQSLVIGHELSRASFDADGIVSAVLDVVTRANETNLPEELKLPERILRHPLVAELKSNLAMFLAGQMERKRQGARNTTTYTPEEVVNVVLPTFISAFGAVSPFKKRVLSDSIAHIGKITAANYDKKPLVIAIYESWNVASKPQAFTPIRQLMDEPQRYLFPQARVTEALNSALKPIFSVVNMERITRAKLDTLELVKHEKAPDIGNGPEFLFGLPSVEMQALAKTSFHAEHHPSPPEITGDMSVRDRMAYDSYATAMHLAVTKAAGTMATSNVEKSYLPFLMFNIRTDLRVPLGSSQIIMGDVITAEPIEVMAYAPDFVHSETLEAHLPDIDQFPDALHAWKWREASAQIKDDVIYTVDLRGSTYKPTVADYEVLGLGARKEDVYFIVPAITRAIAHLWASWAMVEDAFLKQESVAAKGDSLKAAALEARRVHSSLALVRDLVTLSAQGPGKTYVEFITQRLAGEMDKAGKIDAYADLEVGIQRTRLRAWAGLQTFRLTSLLDFETVSNIATLIRDNDALSLMVGIVEA